MNPERWSRLEELVERTSLLPPSERTSFLERECPDPELRAEALSLAQYALDDSTDLENTIRSATESMADRELADRWIGRQLGPYRMAREIGRGGMGVVYEAQRDGDFEMRVAIKVVHGEFVSDHLLQRLRLERQILARLQHPYIARLLDGASVDGLPYLVMEYIEGRSISDYCRENDLSTKARLEVFEKVCRAVQYAHECGVVHRDLKPGNIFVAADGTPKLLDFGIAKLLDQTGAPGQPALTATGFRAMTPEYASPEQIMCQPIGHRSDIYSLGAVLFELLTDRQAQPIGSESPAGIERLVCSTDTDAPSSVRIHASAANRKHRHVGKDLDHVVARAMRKNPQDRYATAGAFADDVRHYLDGQPVAARKRAWAYSASRWIRRRRTYAIAAAVVAAVALLNIGVYRQYAKRATVTWNFTKLSEESGDVATPALSPDGREFVYCALQHGYWELLESQVGSTAPAKNLTANSGVDNTQPAFSPDGRSLAFRSGRNGGGIFLLDLTTRAVRKLNGTGFNPSWSPDGKQIVVADESMIFPDTRRSMKSVLHIIDTATGSARVLADRDAVQPSWSPHGTRIAYWNTEGGRRNIFTIRANGTDPRAVTSDGQTNWNPVWSADGRALYFASDRGGSMNLWQIAIDETTGAVSGPPSAIATPSAYSGQMSAARAAARFAYVQTDLRSNLLRIALDAKGTGVLGQPSFLTPGPRQVKDPSWSPDGTEIALQDLQSRQEDLYVIKRDGSGQRRLTNDVYRDRIPRWSPDGKFILYYSNRSGRYELWRIARDGSDNEQLTRTTGQSVLHGFWSPDQKWIGYNVLGSSPYLVQFEAIGVPGSFPGAKLPDLGTQTTAITDWSPDGKQLAGFVGSSGIVTFDIASRTYRQWTPIGRDPMWMNGSRSLLYHDADTVYALDCRTGAVRKVFSVAPLKLNGRFAISPDRTELVYPVTSSSSDLWLAQPDREPSR